MNYGVHFFCMIFWYKMTLTSLKNLSNFRISAFSPSIIYLTYTRKLMDGSKNNSTFRISLLLLRPIMAVVILWSFSSLRD